MIATAPQPQLVQDDFYKHLFCPFLLPEAAAAKLDFSAKTVIRLAREGQLRGFNIALTVEAEDADITDREPRSMIRIQARSVERLRLPQHFQGIKLHNLQLNDDLLHRRNAFSVWELTHTLDCSADHIRRLVDAKLLTGPSASVVYAHRQISRDSLLNFLTARELHAQ